MTPTDPISPAPTLPRVNRNGPPVQLRSCLESNPAVTLSHSKSTREDFYKDVRFSAVLVFVGYGFLGLMGIAAMVSFLNLDLNRPGGLLFLVVLSLIGTGHYVYRKIFETPYNAEERWVWLDFETRELRQSIDQSGRIPRAWTERRHFDGLSLALESPVRENSSDPRDYEVYLTRHNTAEEALRPEWQRPILEHQQKLYFTSSREDALEVILLYGRLTGCPAWDITQSPGVRIRAPQRTPLPTGGVQKRTRKAKAAQQTPE